MEYVIIPVIVTFIIALPFVAGIIYYLAKENKFSFRQYLIKKIKSFNKININYNFYKQEHNSKKIKNIFLTLKITLGVFFIPILTLSYFSSFGKPYFIGKFITNTVAMSNIPIIIAEGLTGDNFLKPIKFVRNAVFDLGMKFYPENEGERYICWYKLNALEYDANYNKFKNHDKISGEIYSQISPMMLQPIKDNLIDKRRYTYVLKTIDIYNKYNSKIKNSYEHYENLLKELIKLRTRTISKEEQEEKELNYKKILNLACHITEFSLLDIFFSSNEPRTALECHVTERLITRMLNSKYQQYNDYLRANEYDCSDPLIDLGYLAEYNYNKEKYRAYLGHIRFYYGKCEHKDLYYYENKELFEEVKNHFGMTDKK